MIAAAAAPAETSRLARAAEAYFDAFSWLVAQGRSGLPTLPAKVPAASPTSKSKI